MSKKMFARLGAILTALALALPAGAQELLAPKSAPVPYERPTLESETHWLTLALYHEARGETQEGIWAVAIAILNRVDHPDFPSTVGAVVRDGGEKIHACQFSFWCDGRSDEMKDRAAAARVQAIAKDAIAYWHSQPALRTFACPAHSYHVIGHALSPSAIRYFEKLSQTKLVGDHVFYCDRPESEESELTS